MSKYDTPELRLECLHLAGGDLDAARILLAWVLEGDDPAEDNGRYWYCVNQTPREVEWP